MNTMNYQQQQQQKNILDQLDQTEAILYDLPICEQLWQSEKGTREHINMYSHRNSQAAHLYIYTSSPQ